MIETPGQFHSSHDQRGCRGHDRRHQRRYDHGPDDSGGRVRNDAIGGNDRGEEHQDRKTLKPETPPFALVEEGVFNPWNVVMRNLVIVDDIFDQAHESIS